MKSIFLIALCAAAVAHAQAPEADAGTALVPDATMGPDAGMPGPDAVVITVAEPVIEPTPWWRHFKPFGYAKVGVFYTLPTRDEQIPGGNGGFRVAALRLGTIFKPIEALEVVASIEADAPMARSDDPTSGSRIVQMRDAYAEYTVCSGLLVRAGQFKAPFWAETLLADSQLPFISRSVISDGYTAPEFAGQREGLTLDRQVGLQLSSRRLGGKWVGFKYALAVVNGNGANQLLNDNNSVAPVGRLELELFEHVTVGASGYYNAKSEGVRPNRLISNNFGYGADFVAHALGFSVLVGYLGRSTSYPSTALGADTAMGILGQVSYSNTTTGLSGGVRFAQFDPSNADPNDNVTEVTAMLGWQLKAAPLRVLLQYTHRGESPGVSVANDGLDAMLQVTW